MTEEISRAEEILRTREQATGAKYERMERFDGKITLDQFDYLKKTARVIMRSRTGEKAERITANSLFNSLCKVDANLNF